MKTLCVVPFHTISKDILDFLYKIFDVPDTIPYYKHVVVSSMFNDIVTYLVTILPESDEIITAVNNDNLFREFGLGLIDRHSKQSIDILKAHEQEFRILILHVLYELRLYLSTSNGEVYIIQSVDDRNLMCYKHHLHTESDQLVFNGSTIQE